MDWMFLLEMIRQHGHISLFVIMAVGLFFFPVPNEVLLMSGGYLATTYLLDPIPAFIIIYISIIFHGSFLYFIGRLVSKRSQMFQKRKWLYWPFRMNKGKELFARYGLKAAGFSYFFPLVRHAVPFSVGFSNVSYRLFALVGFSSAFIWMSVYYFIGFYYGRTIKDWGSFVEQVIYTLIVIACVVLIYQIWNKKRKRLRESNL